MLSRRGRRDGVVVGVGLGVNLHVAHEALCDVGELVSCGFRHGYPFWIKYGSGQRGRRAGAGVGAGAWARAATGGAGARARARPSALNVVCIYCTATQNELNLPAQTLRVRAIIIARNAKDGAL